MKYFKKYKILKLKIKGSLELYQLNIILIIIRSNKNIIYIVEIKNNILIKKIEVGIINYLLKNKKRIYLFILKKITLIKIKFLHMIF